MRTHSTIPAESDAGPDNILPLSPALLRELRRALLAIRYGAIEIVIHDGRVVQLERREKVRFDTEFTSHQRG
jgi:hypothetical protein